MNSLITNGLFGTIAIIGATTAITESYPTAFIAAGICFTSLIVAIRIKKKTDSRTSTR